MRKKQLLVICLLIAGTLALSACLPKKTDNQGQVGEAKKDKQESTAFANLNELMASNSAWHCTWNFAEEGIDASGELYGRGKKFRQTATYKDGSQTIDIVSVSDGRWMYMWNSSQQGMGSKIEMDKLDELNDKTESDGTGEKTVNLEKDINLVCYPWVVDDSMFVPAADVEYMDLTQMMMQANEMTESGDNCATCNYIPAGAQRDECLKALNCQ